MKNFKIGLTVVFALVSGSSFCVSTPMRQVIGWGRNIGGGGTGFAFPEYYFYTNTINGQQLTDAIALSAGYAHGLALKSDSTVYGWGWNYDGQATGKETKNSDSTNGLVVINGQTRNAINAISAGRQHSLALKKDGTVIGWGEVTIPPGLSNVIAIAAGDAGSLVLKQDGTVLGLGQRKVPSGLSNVVAIAIGKERTSDCLALTKDGKVIVWSRGEFADGQVITSNAVAISSGKGHCLALNQDGTVFGWGSNEAGEATGVPTTTGSYTASGLVTIGGQVLSNVTAIAAGSSFSLALKTDGTVLTWGHTNDFLRRVTPPAGLSNVVAIAAGGDFCLALTTNSSVSSIQK